MDSAWIAFYQFMETIGIKYNDKDAELLEFWAQTAKSCSWFWTFENYVFISDRPTKLNFDGEYRLHSDSEPSFAYSDNWAGYYLHGVNFPKDLWEKVVSKKMPFNEILTIENIDQRTQAMKYGNLREFLKYTKSVLMDTYENWNTKYELWKTPKEANIFQIDAFHLIYSDPTTKLEYMSGVAPEIGIKGNAMESLAWKRSLKVDDLKNAIYA